MSEREQAENLIAFAAHPDARTSLTQSGRDMGLLD